MLAVAVIEEFGLTKLLEGNSQLEALFTITGVATWLAVKGLLNAGVILTLLMIGPEVT